MKKQPNKTHPISAVFQSGLTLIELAVVLAILVALSTLMIPYVGNFIGKAEVATSNYNAAAVLSALQQYYALNGAYPNKLDLLSNDAGGAGGKPVAYLDDTAQVGKPGFIKGTDNTLVTSTNFGTMMDNGGMAASMARVGVTSYFYMKSGTPTKDPSTGEWYMRDDASGARFDATYGSQDIANAGKAGYGPNGEVILSAGTNAAQKVVMWVSDNCGGWWMQGHPECLANILGYRNCKIDKAGVCPLVTGTDANGQTKQFDQSGAHMLILLGVNQNNDMITVDKGQRTMTTAPVHFPENKSTNPGLVYSRFLAVFDVDMRANCWKDTVGCDPAQLVGVVVGPDATRGWQTATTGLARAFKQGQ